MKIAILSSGTLRTLQRCYPTHRWQLYRPLARAGHDLHFFGHFKNDPRAEDQLADLRHDFGERAHISFANDPSDDNLAELLGKETAAAAEIGWHEAPFANAASVRQLLLQHWSQQQAYERFRESPEFTSFDVIIRLRCDLWFHEMDLQQLMGWSYLENARTVLVPWWGGFGGYNDRFAVMSAQNAMKYFTLFEQLGSLLSAGCPFHPESLLKAALCEAQLDVRKEHFLFSTERSPDHPDYQRAHRRFPEITAWDIRPSA